MKICTHGHSIQWLFSLNYDKEGNHLLRGCMWPRYSQSLVLADGVSIYLSLLSMLQTQGRHLWYSPKSTHWGLILTLSPLAPLASGWNICYPALDEVCATEFSSKKLGQSDLHKSTFKLYSPVQLEQFCLKLKYFSEDLLHGMLFYLRVLIF